MSGETLCKYNQSGYCKYRLDCRNRHENKICPKEYKYTSKECSFRHPKGCKHFSREGSCRFGEDCSYRHEKNKYQNVKDTEEKHANEIDTLRKIKETILY